MAGAVTFWEALLQIEPIKRSSHWSEFKLGEAGVGLLLNDFDERSR